MVDRARGGQVENPGSARAKPEGLSCSISPSRPQPPEFVTASATFLHPAVHRFTPQFRFPQPCQSPIYSPISVPQDRTVHRPQSYFKIAAKRRCAAQKRPEAAPGKQRIIVIKHATLQHPKTRLSSQFRPTGAPQRPKFSSMIAQIPFIF